MDRFTYKDKNGNYQLDDEYVEKLGIDINGLSDITDYIGEKEDLEEQIECPLVILGKALKNGIYAINLFDKNKINYIPAVTLSNCGTEWYLSDHLGFCINVKDYKELFWLKEDKSE